MTDLTSANIDGSTMHYNFELIKRYVFEKFGNEVKCKFEQTGKFTGRIILQTEYGYKRDDEVFTFFRRFCSHAVTHRLIKPS